MLVHPAESAESAESAEFAEFAELAARPCEAAAAMVRLDLDAG